MKVTVCFGNTKVVVPCGNGDLLVGELIEKATIRYRKAIGKPSDYWVSVQSLKSSSDGGILDADDQLKDVADDREQILALYDEQDAPPVPHNGGDGTSASSVGTSSPDIFQGGEYNNNKDYHDYLRQTRKNDVIITQNDLNSHHSGSSLIVRRGSEPSLTKIIDNGPDRRPDFLPQNSDNKRWSAIASLDEAKSPRASEADDEHGYDTPPPTLERVGGIGQELDGQNSHNSSFSNFSRGSSRRSLANNAAMIKWLEAQEKAQDKFDSEFQPGRREPLGGRAEDEVKLNGVTKLSLLSPSKQGELIVIPNSTGPLGIHVVPELENGREKGLLIQSIDAGGRIYRDGRMHPADVIVEINGTNLTGVDFAKAQEVFRQALTAPDLRLRILRAPPPLPSHPPPVARPLTTPPSSPTSNSNGSLPSRTPPSTPSKQNNNDPTTSPPPSPTRGPPPPIPARNPTTALTSTSARITVSNTRKIGKKIHIQLTKGAAGLGFSVTTRDNPAGGHAPIYIKNILPKGAAIEDGRLKPGDRLLEVNGIEMTGKSQTEAVTVLRNTKINGVVNLVVSRQVLENEEDNDETTVSDSSSVQKSTNEESLTEDAVSQRETLSLKIPMTDMGSAGLGLNVKGKTVTTETGIKDLGIFIKAIIDGGSAAQDGRLKVNDKLIEVNSEKLGGKTNPEAMEVLRRAVQKDAEKPSFIYLVVSRKVWSSANLPLRTSSVHEARISQSDNKIYNDQVLNQNKVPNKNRHSISNSIPDSSKFNPFIARVKRDQSLRNTSYQIANHDSLVNETVDSVFPEPMKPDSPPPADTGISSQNSSQNSSMRHSLLTEADQHTVRMRHSSSSSNRERPASTLGFLPSQPEPGSRLSVSKSNQDLLDGGSPRWQKQSTELGDDEKSPTEEIDPNLVFSREGFGRQSMSEKRKGHMDPRVSEFYQKIKSNKDSTTGQFLSASWDPRRSAFQQVKGSRNDNKSLKRVASAESLLGHTNRLSLHDPPAYPHAPPPYISRLHSERHYPCPDGVHQGLPPTDSWYGYGFPQPMASMGLLSYRSQPCLVHIAQTEELGPMLGLKKSSSLESLQRAVQDEEELSDTSSVQRNRGINESFRAAVDRSYEGQQAETMETVEEEGSETGSVIQTAGSRAPSFSGPEPDKDKKHKSKKEKEKGIFKGLFKFGKAKKDEKSAKVATEDSKPLKQSDRQRAPSTDQLTDTQEENRLREYQKKQQEKLRLLEQQRDIENQARQQRDQGFLRPTSPPPRASNRAEKIQLLRHEHQKRHQERQGHYPQEDREELHERQIQEYEAQKTVLRSGNDTSVYGVYPVPPRRRYDDSMSYERARPAYVDPDHYGHYQNLQEIQAQLRQQEYYQQRYHQQTPSNYSSHSSLHTPSTYSSHSNTGHHYAREVKIPPRDPRDPRDLRNYSHHMGYAPHYHPDPHYPPQGYYTPHHHPAYRSVTPSPHPHAPTPHSAYTTKSNPQIVVNPPPQDYSHPRSYSDYDDHQRSVYHPEPHYGSLPRRREHRETTMVPGSAQV